MSKDKLDSQIEGQMTIEEYLNPPERLFAVSRIFARARKNMSLAEQKTFVYALSQIKFKEKAASNVVYLDKKVLARILGVTADPDHLSVNIHRLIKDLSTHSTIEIADQDRKFYDNGTVVTRVTMRETNVVRIKFEEEYLPLFTGLDNNYLTMWSSDIFRMKSIRSVQFYELLRQETDTRRAVNSIALGTKAIKDMFGIPKEGKGSYMREKGGFNRTQFEKKVIDPICADLQKTRMIRLVIQPDGRPYEKVKRGNKVDGYRFFWSYTSHPAVAAASEVLELQERVDKNPQIMKVARDIVDGKPKKEERGFFAAKENMHSVDQLRELEDLLWNN